MPSWCRTSNCPFQPIYYSYNLGTNFSSEMTHGILLFHYLNCDIMIYTFKQGNDGIVSVLQYNHLENLTHVIYLQITMTFNVEYKPNPHGRSKFHHVFLCIFINIFYFLHGSFSILHNSLPSCLPK